MSNFIFVFLDDASLDVVSTGGNMNEAYEGIDVENGQYAFFDCKLRKLTPKFTLPNKNGSIFGLRWISSGSYILEASGAAEDEFMKRLRCVSAVNANPWFETIQQIEDYVSSLGST